jgi:prepilin-type N-terminal cleavage/methylation domain-containing protein
MKARGFTLVEIIVVVAVISILSSMGMYGYMQAGKKSRDFDRQADLRTLKTAIELYKQKNGRYPAACNGPGAWSGQLGTTYACPGGSAQYIIGLAPGYIRFLPQDKRLNGTDSGYVYATNTDGTVYKIEARKTVESEVVSYSHPLKSCEATDSSTGYCDDVYPSGSKPQWCEEGDPLQRFQTSYAIWGGYANAASQVLVERLTEDIICEIP